MDATAVWKNGLSFTGTGHTSGFSVPLGADTSVGGQKDGFRPLELLIVGLAGCTGMDVISILSKKQQQVSAFEVKVHGENAAEHPKVFTSILVEYVVTGKALDPSAVQKAVELSATKYCPAIASLRKAATIETKITILEG